VTDDDAIVEHAAGLHKAQTRGQITMMRLGIPRASWSARTA
jgi:hypothetical protein